MAKITINRDTFHVDERELEQGTLSIGRHPENSLHIDDPTVSSHHAQIVTVFETSYVEDLGSTNGTFVNGKKTKTHTLHNGDLLTIGQYQLFFQADNSAQMQNANATMMMGVSQLEELTKKTKKQAEAAQQAKATNPPPRTKSAVQNMNGNATQELPPHLVKAASKPALKVHENNGEPQTNTDELPDIEDGADLFDPKNRASVSETMRPLRKSDTSPIPSLKVIALAVLATIATFTLLMLFFK